MDRKKTLLKGITKEMRGVEIAPWFNPLASKGEGYQILSLDFYDTESLLRIAASDPNISESDSKKIEAVDLVGSAVELGSLVKAKGLEGQLDYILSSHNFEHLPDPIRFLQGCQESLVKNGILSMAIPDRRGCFDYFRPYSTTANFLEPYLLKRRQPSPFQTFSQHALSSQGQVNGNLTHAWNANFLPDFIRSNADLQSSYKQLLANLENPDPAYQDTHCWVLTPSVFKLIILDLIFLDIINLTLDFVSLTNGSEFYVRFRNRPPLKQSSKKFYENRNLLLNQIIKEQSPQQFFAILRKIPGISFLTRIVRSIKNRLAGN